MKKYQIKGIAIDFDGVIVDSQPMHFQAWLDITKKLKLQINLKPEDIIGVSVESFAKTLGLPDNMINEVVDLKKELVIKHSLISPPPLYPLVNSTLATLFDRFKLALVSSVESRIAINTLKYYKLYDLFTVLVLENDYEKPKPSPDPYLKCLRKMHLNPNEVIAIEDSQLGVKSAKNAGLVTIGIVNTSEKNKLKRADFIIDRFDQIIPVIDNIIVSTLP
jgi:HAD superfamily hydrolase (TIGR01509 family)